MVITRENNEIVIRIPDSTQGLEAKELQAILDYIIYRGIVSKSQASQAQVDELVKEVNSSWWNENKSKFLG